MMPSDTDTDADAAPLVVAPHGGSDLSMPMLEEADQASSGAVETTHETLIEETTAVFVAALSFPSASSSLTPWTQRTFSEMRPGSIRGSIFTLTSGAIGAGVLMLPYALRITTPAIFILVLGFAALTAARSLQLCCSAMETCQESNYVRVLEKLYPPAVSKICVVMLATACFGLSCVYFVLASQTVGKIFGMSRWSTIAIVTPIIGPLAAFKRFSAFRYVSLLGVVGIFFLAALVVFEMPKAAAHVADNDKESLWKFQGWKNLIKGVNLCLNGFVVHNFVFAVYHELHNRTPTRMNKVIQRSVALECGVYFIVALFGFLSFRAGTPQNILLGYPLSTSVMSRHLAILGQGAMLIQLLVSCPMCLHPARAYGYSLVCSGPMRTRTHYISTVVLVAGVIIVYIIVPDVINLMGIVGGFACTTYAFFVPSLIVVQLRRQFPDGAVGPGAGHISLKLCAWLFCISLISYTAGFLSVIDLVQK